MNLIPFVLLVSLILYCMVKTVFGRRKSVRKPKVRKIFMIQFILIIRVQFEHTFNMGPIHVAGVSS